MRRSSWPLPYTVALHGGTAALHIPVKGCGRVVVQAPAPPDPDHAWAGDVLIVGFRFGGPARLQLHPANDRFRSRCPGPGRRYRQRTLQEHLRHIDPNRVAYCEPAAIECNRTPMCYPRVLFHTLAPMLVPVLLLGGCIMPTRQDATPVPPFAEPPMVEPAQEAAEDLIAVVNQDANVRTGPGTDHAVAYWLTAGAEVTVVGWNVDGDWLRIKHDNRPGWIFTALTDIAAEGAAELPADAPPVEPAPEPVPAEPTPEPEPMPEMVAPTPAVPDRVTAAVTGIVVNLRRGPGTDHPTHGQVRSGDPLQVTGRNADGSWLRVMHPVETGGLMWIYAPLTDIDAATVQALTEVTAVKIEVATPPAPEPIVEPEPGAAPAPVVEPEPKLKVATLPDLVDCIQWHTVNQNETRLKQITDWYSLDLATVAAINGMEPDAPLVAGERICLAAGQELATQVQDTDEEATVEAETRATTPASALPPPAGCPACPFLPDFPERGHPNAPIGQKVVDSPLGVLWHAPGSYSRDLPGPDYDFAMVFSDDSAMWTWSVRDFQACYDAVRVHMGGVASEVNLQRLEVRLSDPAYPQNRRGYVPDADYGNWYQSPWANLGGLPDWPNWDPATVPHPDLGLVTIYCDYSPPTGQISFDIYPDWGNSHSIHLNAYLFPILDNRRGDPAGQGPCLDVARAR